MLRSLRLTRFKSFAETTLTVGPLTLLVGANASGKSNVRNALQFLHGCALGYSLAEVIDEKWGQSGALLWPGLRGGPREVAHYGSESFRLAAEVDLGTDGGPHRGPYWYTIEVRLGTGTTAPRVVAESLSGRELVFASQPRESTAHEAPEHLEVWVPGAGDGPGKGPPRRYLAGRTALVQVAEDAQVPEEDRKTARAALEVLRDMRFLDLAPSAMREPSTPGHLTLGDRGENLSSVLLGIAEDPRRKSALIGWLQALVPVQVTDLRFKEDFQGRILVHLVEAEGHEISAFSASDGILRFLALAAALLGPESGRFYFIEEIDNGIHPTRLHLVLDILGQASRQLKCQVLATTHNPQLVSFLPESALQDALLLYRREQDPATQAVRILDLPDVRRVLASQDLGRLLATGWLEDTVNFLSDQGLRGGGGERAAATP